MRIPNPQNQFPFSIPNSSDKNGDIWYTKNVHFDKEGYIRLSPRTVQIYDEATNDNFDVPVKIARYSSGDYQIMTADEAFNASIGSSLSITFTENSGTNEPNGTINSHGVSWQDRIHVSEATAVLSKAINGNSSATWTDRITSLTTGVRHHLEVFKSRATLCVTNDNIVQQYDTNYSTSGISQLTLDSSFEAVGLAYNNNQMGIITRFGATTEGQNQEAFFFIWDGADTSVNGGWGIGAESAIAICAYKSSWLILTSAGQLKYFNGGGFDDVANFPFYFTDNVYGNFLNQRGRGSLMWVDGDIVYINISLQLSEFGRNQETQLQQAPSGVWCYDSKIGLYHRYSPSLSQAYGFNVTDANVDISTNILTANGTVPQTGSIARYLSATTVIGGLELYEDYYVIKLSSTTFKLAETKAEAIAGTAIDLTSKGSDGNNGFWMFDIVDYGQTHTVEAGAITTTGQVTMQGTDILFGSDLYDSSLDNDANLSLCVPELESRGYVVTSKVFSPEITNNEQKIFVKHSPLKDSDSIVVKYRVQKPFGLPITTPQAGLGGTWSNNRTIYSSADLSSALTAFGQNKELELEVVAGIGAGTCVKIENIRQGDDDVYVIVVEEEVIGVTEGLESHFIIDHWIEAKTITSATEMNNKGYTEVPIGDVGSWVQYKVEMRGTNIEIDELQTTEKINKRNA